MASECHIKKETDGPPDLGLLPMTQESLQFPKEQEKKKKKSILLTDHEEMEMVQWLRDNEVLYNKGRRDFKDQGKKSQLWEDKAVELCAEASELKTWFDSMRTRYGKLTAAKYGDNGREPTERDVWILKNFSFLHKHISRHSSSLRAKRISPLSDIQCPSQPESENQDELQEDSDTPIGAIAEQSTTAFTPPPSKRLKHSSSNSDTHFDNFDTTLHEPIIYKNDHHPFQLHSNRHAGIPDNVMMPSSRTLWGQWITSQLSDIHETLWDRFLRESFNMMMYYSSETQTLRNNEQKQD